MSEKMTAKELIELVKRVFIPKPNEKAVGIMVDLPDAKVGDDPAWAARREIALEWVSLLRQNSAELGLDTHLVAYANVRTNNGDLPEKAWILEGGRLPALADGLDPNTAVTMEKVYADHPILIAITKFSSTAPLKMAAKKYGIRAATMPGFGEAMIPALRLDYTEINRRVHILKELLDRATGADLVFSHSSGQSKLHLDLRHRPCHASGGLVPDPGIAGNLPSGEAYIVPYEGEIPGDASRSEGELPVQFGNEIVIYQIKANRAVKVLSDGPESKREVALLAKEPGYSNLAELGLGVLAPFGIKPIGAVLLDEKLGLHIAFGRSEHFGGQVGPDAFSSPEAVIHIDRVYVPEMQPDICPESVDLHFEDGKTMPLMKKGDYVISF
jgi:leucyl aminopeptidase (aminopeptidase T)